MIDDDIRELEKLIVAYDKIHGEGKGHEIFGALLCTYGLHGQIRIFKRAKGRKIIISYPEEIIDGLHIRYKNK